MDRFHHFQSDVTPILPTAYVLPVLASQAVMRHTHIPPIHHILEI